MTGTNPVASYTPPDFTTQEVVQYKTNLDGAAAVFQRSGDNFAPRQTSTPAMTVTLDAGHVFNGIGLTEVASQTSGTITAPVSHPRIDRVVISSISGAMSVITGAENVSPVPPAIPAFTCPVAQILLQTSTVLIGNSIITDERDFSDLGGASGLVVGSIRNLIGIRTGNATATFAADECVLKSALGGACLNVPLNLSLNCAGTGANGLDNGSLAINSFVYVYAIFNPTTLTVAALATTSGSGASIYGGSHMPSGYTLSALIGVLLTDGSAHFLPSTQIDREVFYTSPISVLSSATGQAAFTSQSTSSAVPPNARTCSGFLMYAGTGNDALAVAMDSSGTAQQQGTITGGTIASLSGVCAFRQLPIAPSSAPAALPTAQTLFWKTGGTSAGSSGISISSFSI